MHLRYFLFTTSSAADRLDLLQVSELHAVSLIKYTNWLRDDEANAYLHPTTDSSNFGWSKYKFPEGTISFYITSLFPLYKNQQEMQQSSYKWWIVVMQAFIPLSPNSLDHM